MDTVEQDLEAWLAGAVARTDAAAYMAAEVDARRRAAKEEERAKTVGETSLGSLASRWRMRRNFLIAAWGGGTRDARWRKRPWVLDAAEATGHP